MKEEKQRLSQFFYRFVHNPFKLDHSFYTTLFYTIIVLRRTLFHKLFPPLSRSNVALSFCANFETLRKGAV